MSYRLKRREKVGKGLRRLVREQADKALAEITARNGDKDIAIHDARVCFKKIRAMLRLARDRMNGTFQEENALYRDLGRRLARVRTDVALLESLSKLKDRFGSQISTRLLTRPRRPLAESNARHRREKEQALKEVAGKLRRARRRIGDWSFGGNGLGVLSGGLKRTYKQGRTQCAVSRRHPTVENLHEWRKEVKNLRYQLGILKRAWPEEVGIFGGELSRLGDYLSDHHDLAVLRQHVAENGEADETATVLALIDQRTAEVRREARLLGERLYAEKPSAFVSRYRHYWQVWRKEPKAAASATTESQF